MPGGEYIIEVTTNAVDPFSIS